MGQPTRPLLSPVQAPGLGSTASIGGVLAAVLTHNDFTLSVPVALDAFVVAVPPVAAALALLAMLGGRYLYRTHDEPSLGRGRRRHTPGVDKHPCKRRPPALGVAEAADRHVKPAVAVTMLLRRRRIDTGLAPVAGYLTGKRVLVTGAGGSIGSELCRQIQLFEPGELMMLDRDESALHAVQLSLHGRALLDSAEVVLGDLRDREAMQEVFASRRPQVVFHAAALKHLPLLERHPREAVKTNIWGTQTLLELSCGVERFVNVSTDKAANPTSVLGYSKRITERLTAYAATRCEGIFLSVRFGNVLGSRGSVLGVFAAQAAAGGPITVTHPDVTRYIMTIGEAVQLVLHGAAIGCGGEALVLDMGKPVRIADMARQVAQQAARPVDIVYTGLRPGEKLHEELFGEGEATSRPLHPLISHVTVPPLHPSHAQRLNSHTNPDKLVATLAELCHTAPGTADEIPPLYGHS